MSLWRLRTGSEVIVTFSASLTLFLSLYNLQVLSTPSHCSLSEKLFQVKSIPLQTHSFTEQIFIAWQFRVKLPAGLNEYSDEQN